MQDPRPPAGPLIAGIGNPVYDVITTPHVRTAGRVLSGCSTNACLAARRLGRPALLVGAVGADFRERFVADLQRYDIAHALQPSEQTGGFALDYYDEHGNRTLDVLGIADPIHSLPAGLERAGFVLLGPIMGEVSHALVRQARAATRAPLLLDPQGLVRRIAPGGDGRRRAEHYRNPELDAIIPLCDVVKANEVETQVITGIEPRRDGPAAVRALHALGCRIAIVTLAEAGSWIYDGPELLTIPAFATVARDPTGAGDTYAAGFMVKYGEAPRDLRAVGCFASAVASVMVEHTGPDFPLTRAEAERRAAQLYS
jgi:sugar/nucleoside kinase (ribokinase family)